MDKSVEDARPYIEAAGAQHPALIDSDHRVAHLYGIINISTVVWIDEEGRIVRPPAIEYGTDTFKEFHGRESAPHLEAVRRWVREGTLPLRIEDALAGQVPPTAREQRARAEFSLAWHLVQAGDSERAESHFEQAGRLAPFDWTIRRGSMPIRGKDPFAEEFFDLFTEWRESGSPTYASMAAERRKG